MAHVTLDAGAVIDAYRDAMKRRAKQRGEEIATKAAHELKTALLEDAFQLAADIQAQFEQDTLRGEMVLRLSLPDPATPAQKKGDEA